ncbi:hypothetical protein C8R44DRAFT_60262 [Mycena epipterygia]|nr:hypothetical protein C8R44DRAFT_60262 [Mycena epipterygia]
MSLSCCPCHYPPNVLPFPTPSSLPPSHNTRPRTLLPPPPPRHNALCSVRPAFFRHLRACAIPASLCLPVPPPCRRAFLPSSILLRRPVPFLPSLPRHVRRACLFLLPPSSSPDPLFRSFMSLPSSAGPRRMAFPTPGAHDDPTARLARLNMGATRPPTLPPPSSASPYDPSASPHAVRVSYPALARHLSSHQRTQGYVPASAGGWRPGSASVSTAVDVGAGGGGQWQGQGWYGGQQQQPRRQGQGQ